MHSQRSWMKSSVSQRLRQRMNGHRQAVDGADEVAAVVAAGLVILQAGLTQFG